jgi:pSer/pThr/pTyr-binding forkhead associated (FHA) protein
MTILKIEDITDSQPIEIGALTDDIIRVGRAEDSNLRIESGAVSSEHAVFVPFRGHWYLKDKDSTNGTWLNQRKLQAELPVVVKNGDVIQLADRMLRLVGDAPPQHQSLIVFSRGEIVDEFVIPKVGRALVIGGANADLKLDVDIHELPSLVVESRGDSVVAYPIARETTSHINGKTLDRLTALKDGDELDVMNYTVHVHLPKPEKRQQSHSHHLQQGHGNPSNYQAPPHAEAFQTSSEVPDHPGVEALERLASSGDGWEDPRQMFGSSGSRTRIDIPFGRGEARPDEEFTPPRFSGSRHIGTDVHPSMRTAIEDNGPPALSVLEDRIVIIIGGLLLLVLVVLLAIWVVNALN